MIRRIVFLTLTFAILLIGFIQHFLTVQAQDKQNNGKASAPASTTNNVDCDTSPIAELNEGIQLRFKTIDGSLNFGIRRALPATRNYHLRRNYLLTFIPNTVQEILAVNQLEEEGWQAGFYVVGRSILEQKPNKELWDNAKNEYYARKPINNPVRITPYIKEEDFPSAWELYDEAQKAMKVFEKSNQYDFTAGKWAIAARPVRVSDQACLQCHLGNEKLILRGREVIELPDTLSENTKAKQPNEVTEKSQLKIGDPIGAVLYAYRRKQ